jgi:hypothetical protein
MSGRLLFWQVFALITALFDTIWAAITYVNAGAAFAAQGIQLSQERLQAVTHYQLSGSTHTALLDNVSPTACAWATALDALALYAWSSILSGSQQAILPHCTIHG